MRQRRLAALLVSITCALELPAADAPRVQSPVDGSMRRAAPAPPAQRDSLTVDLIVRFKQPARGITTSAIASRREKLGARVADLARDVERIAVRRSFHRVLYGASVRVPAESRASVAALPYVESVQEDRHFEPYLAQSVPWIRAPQVWSDYGTRGAGVTVAVIDTGIDYLHPALGGGIGSGFKVIGGWDFYDNDDDPMDEDGHGTHVAGIVAADGNGILGVAPDVKLLAYRALTSQGGSESDVIAAIERAVDPNQDGDTSDHADIVNLSLGGVARPDDAAAAAVEAATTAGVLFTISAGNSGWYGYIPTPAIAPSSIAVGATDDWDRVAAFSSRGPSWDFSVKPEVVAPGVGIVSTMRNGKTAELQGTSMAAPHVAAVAALVKAVHPDWTPAQIKSAIVTTALPLDGDVMDHGGGRVDARSATSVATLASPVAVGFGQIDVRVPAWTQTRTVTLRNVTAQPQTLTSSVSGAIDGVSVQVAPPVVTLGPGESAPVTIALTVNNKNLPSPKEGSLSFGGLVAWTGGAVPIHVPWAFVKASFLSINIPDARRDSMATILGTNFSMSTDFFWGDTRVFWPMEKVDVVVVGMSSPSRNLPYRILVAENVDTVTDPLLVLHEDEAKFTFAADTTDETGAPLGRGGRQCTEQVALSFPSGRKWSHGQTPSDRALWAPFSERVASYMMNSCADVSRSALWATIHEPIRGLKGNVISTQRPQWLQQDVSFAGATDGHMTAALASLRFPGPAATYYAAGGQFYLMRPTGPALRMYYTKSPGPEVDLLGTLERWSRCYEPSMGHDVDCPFVGTSWLYLGESGVRVDTDLFLEISPMAYHVPAGRTLVYGEAPRWAQMGFAASPGFWTVGPMWKGPLGEPRQHALENGHTTLRNAAGEVIGEGTGYLWKWESLEQGSYQAEAIDRTFSVAGIPGTSTLRSTLETSRTDNLFPWLTGLRVEDGDGMMTTVVGRNEPASLVFSVADLQREGVWQRRVPPRESATRAEYRLRGTSEWRPLTPLVVGRHYLNNNFLFAGVGTVYRADLSAATREILGGIDIRLYAEDMSGNSVELVVEPALFVGDRPKPRAVRR